jgi:hypothetical protein
LHVIGVREQRGDTVAWWPPISSEEDPERWAVAFSGFLARFSEFEEIEVRLRLKPAGKHVKLIVPSLTNPRVKRANRRKAKDVRAFSAVVKAPPGSGITHSCGGCSTNWRGTSRVHCSHCHRTFARISLFEKHRKIKGSCIDPETIMKRGTGVRVMFLRDDIWQGVETLSGPAAENRGSDFVVERERDDGR